MTRCTVDKNIISFLQLFIALFLHLFFIKLSFALPLQSMIDCCNKYRNFNFQYKAFKLNIVCSDNETISFFTIPECIFYFNNL